MSKGLSVGEAPHFSTWVLKPPSKLRLLESFSERLTRTADLSLLISTDKEYLILEESSMMDATRK